MRHLSIFILLLTMNPVGCSCDGGGQADAGSSFPDAGAGEGHDAGLHVDAGSMDAGAPDAGTNTDAGPSDVCGDDIVGATEECDPPDELRCSADCASLIPAWTCDPLFFTDGVDCDCGCGLLDPDCGDAATIDSCSFCDSVGSCSEGIDCAAVIDPANLAECLPPECGNMLVEEDEACDPPSIGCDAQCQTIPDVCGNGIIEENEACEPPDGLVCDAMCQPIVIECGDGIIQPGETCDPPEAGLCSAECLFIPPADWSCNDDWYGDGSCDCGCDAQDLDCPTGLGVEECAFCPGECNVGGSCPGFINPDDNTSCVPPVCGNGLLEFGEACETPGDGVCGLDCQKLPDVCGNDIVDGEDEQCDPPDGVACDATCQTIALECGNSIVQEPEECDPPGMYCDTQCIKIVPAEWGCNRKWYFDGGFCDCACGAVDPDCGDSPSISDCVFCDTLGSCGSGACPANIDTMDIGQCVQ